MHAALRHLEKNRFGVNDILVMLSIYLLKGENVRGPHVFVPSALYISTNLFAVYLDQDAICYSVNHSHVDSQQSKTCQHYAKHVTYWDYSEVYCHRCHAIQQDNVAVVPET